MAGKKFKTLTYEIDLDSSGFNNGINTTKKEIREANKVMRETISPAEKFRQEMAKLDHLYKTKGAIGVEAYNRRTKQLQKTLKAQTKTVSRLGKAFDGISSSMKAAIGIGALTAGVKLFGDAIVETANRMDMLTKSAQKIGTSTEFLSGLAYVAKTTSGASSETSFDVVQEMMVKLGEAQSDLKSEANETFKRLNIDVNTLIKKRPEEVFKRVSAAVREIGDETKQIYLIDELLGDQGVELLSVMRKQTGEYDEQIKKARELGLIQDEYANKRAADMKKRMAEFNALKEGAMQQAAIGTVDLYKGIGGLYSGVQNLMIGGSFTAAFDKVTMGRDVAKLATQETRDAYRKQQAEQDRLKAEQAAADKAAAKVAAADYMDTWNNVFIDAAKKFDEESRFNVESGLLSAFEGTQQQATTAIVQRQFDPSQSITAGSSESFMIANRSRMGETVDVQKKQLTAQEETAAAVTGLFDIAKADNPEPVNL